MNLDEALKHTAVIGAAGKMGSGISLILLEEISLLEAKNTGEVGKGGYRLHLIDSDVSALSNLRIYLRTHLKKMAERQINRLRQAFANNPKLVSNEEMIVAYVEGAMDIIHPAVQVEEAKNATLVFEAVGEDLSLKCEVFRRLLSVSTQPVNIFTNTSSIPIHVLNESGHLQNRIIGFHFYSPPAVQKLVELIPLGNGEPLLYEWAYELSKRLQKRLVVSRDVAGFIGNGFLVREALYACAKVRELTAKYSLPQAIYIVNKVTQELLLRPMGIFQLLDYVGIPIASKIGQVMNSYLSHGCYDDALIESMLRESITGGQFTNGFQKDGFFRYHEHDIVAVYSLEEKKYIPLEGEWKREADEFCGGLPPSHEPWKTLHKKQNREPLIKKYFDELSHLNTPGAELARNFLYRDCEICRTLLFDRIAPHQDDIKAVLQNGFFHLYSPEEAIRREGNLCAL